LARSRSSPLAVGLLAAGLLLGGAPGAAALDTRAGVEELAAQIERLAPEGRQVRLAVTDFRDAQGVTSDYGRFVADRLIARLGRNLRLMPIERRFFEELLKQSGLRGADLGHPDPARRLMQAYPVDLLVLCRLAEIGTFVNLEARVLDASSLEMLGVATANVDKDPRLQRFLDSGRE
jgi:hypothetical protein